MRIHKKELFTHKNPAASVLPESVFTVNSSTDETMWTIFWLCALIPVNKYVCERKYSKVLCSESTDLFILHICLLA